MRLFETNEEQDGRYSVFYEDLDGDILQYSLWFTSYKDALVAYNNYPKNKSHLFILKDVTPKKEEVC